MSMLLLHCSPCLHLSRCSVHITGSLGEGGLRDRGAGFHYIYVCSNGEYGDDEGNCQVHNKGTWKNDWICHLRSRCCRGDGWEICIYLTGVLMMVCGVMVKLGQINHTGTPEWKGSSHTLVSMVKQPIQYKWMGGKTKGGWLTWGRA